MKKKDENQEHRVERRKLGRPRQLLDGKAISIILDSETRAILGAHGSGNWSAFIREILLHSTLSEKERAKRMVELMRENEELKKTVKARGKVRGKEESASDTIYWRGVLKSFKARRAEFALQKRQMSKAADINWLRDAAKRLKTPEDELLAAIFSELKVTEEQVYSNLTFQDLLQERGNE